MTRASGVGETGTSRVASPPTTLAGPHRPGAASKFGAHGLIGVLCLFCTNLVGAPGAAVSQAPARMPIQQPARAVVRQPTRAVAQQPTGAVPLQQTPGEYAREAFTYPVGNRRSPFRPLQAGIRAGPRLDDLVLTGVLFNPIGGSVATLTDRQTGRRYRVREDDLIGELRVSRIDRAEVGLVSTLGIIRREVLKVRKQGKTKS